MKELKLSEEDQLALVEALENETPPSKEVFASWMEAVSAYRKGEDAGFEIKEVFEGSKVFIRWVGGNSGEYILHKDYYGRYYVYDSLGNVNYSAGEVFVDTESVELM